MSRSFFRWLVLFGVLLAGLMSERAAFAHSNGIAVLGCSGCHGGAAGASVKLSATPSTFSPGQTLQFALTIASSGIQKGGAYVTTGDVGKLQALPSQGMAVVSGGLVHDRPKAASNGAVTFNFAWQAPASPGNVRFRVSVLAANGDGRNSGDEATEGTFDFVFGCTGKSYFLDADGDGFGEDAATELACDAAPPAGYSIRGGDCDDYAKTTYPGAPELCNQVDDNCDRQIDENALPVELWPDGDSDGYYDERTEKVGMPKLGCSGLKGWSAVPGDCNPHDATVHPNGTEVCNNVDDDCDGEVDERVRPACGEGWCRRESPTCDAMYCEIGRPVAERCNLLDDDCDGLTDEDPNLCPSGQTCAAGICVVDEDETSGSGGSGSANTPNHTGNPVAPSSCGFSSSRGGLATPFILALFALWFVSRRRG